MSKVVPIDVIKNISMGFQSQMANCARIWLKTILMENKYSSNLNEGLGRTVDRMQTFTIYWKKSEAQIV